MAYSKLTDIPCEADETVVQLDTGEYVAVRCPATNDTLLTSMLFAPRARWIDESGTAQFDNNGKPVITGKDLPMAIPRLSELGAAVAVKEHLLLVLGEPLTPSPDDPAVSIIPWGVALIAQCSIRNAIAAARISPPDAGAVL